MHSQMCVFEYEEIPLVILKCELLGPAKVNECQTFKYKFKFIFNLVYLKWISKRSQDDLDSI